MQYKINQTIVCNVEIRNYKSKRIARLDYETKNKIIPTNFVIIGKNGHEYKILLPEDYLGWTIGKWHILHQDVNKKYEGQKFWDITEEYILPEETQLVNAREKRIT